MSRRKQSNPKPLKRKAEEELEELAESLQLPSEVLTLREGSEPSPEVTAYTKVMLQGGTLFGPYPARLVNEPSVNANHVTIRCKEGTTSYLSLKDAGVWLKTLRLVQRREEANASLSLEGNEVWCSLTHDVVAGRELLAHFTVSNPERKKPIAVNVHGSDDLKRTAEARMFSGVEAARREETSVDEASDEVDIMVDVDADPDAEGDVDKLDAGGAAAVAADSDDVTSTIPGTLSKFDDGQVDAGNRGDGDSVMTTDEYATRLTVRTSPSQAEVKLEAESPAASVAGRTSEGFVSDDAENSPDVVSKDHKPAILAADRKLEHVNGYSPLRGTVSAMVLQVPTLPTQAFECGMCGIQFSSGRTLRAHQTYYCNRRLDKAALPEARFDASEYAGTAMSPGPRSSPHENGESGGESSGYNAPAKRPRREDAGSPISSDASSTTSKSPKTSSGRSYQCPFCAYAYDRKGSLTRHMRLHSSPPSPGASDAPMSSAQDVAAPPAARYCANCDIQFSSYKTFTVHKQFYCNTRHVQKSVPTATVATTVAHSSEQVLLNQPLFAAISTNPLILVPCSYVPGNGLVPTTAAGLRTDLSSGSAITPAILCAQQANVPAASTAPVPESQVEAEENGARPKETGWESVVSSPRESKVESPPLKQEQTPETPLDLRLKKDAKGVSSPGVSSSPVPGSSGDTPQQVPPSPAVVIGGLDPLLALGDAGQVVVKQGTSRCRECNIVFYKYENYLAHKRHYCASRQHKLGRMSSPSGDEASPSEYASKSPAANATSPEASVAEAYGQRSVGGVQSPQQQPMYQFYCLACGIKFTSLSNLQAHQTYYCPKRDILKGQVGVAAVTRPAEFACGRCRLSYPTDEALKQHLCAAALRKCPYCDVFCPTQIAAQRHLVTHTGVRAFRCAACGYKGHTLRGMRTHVRVHLEKGTQLQEDALILCVGADGSTVCPWSETAASAAARAAVAVMDTPTAPRSPVEKKVLEESSQPSSARSGSPPTATAASEESSSFRISEEAQQHQATAPPSELLHWCNLCGYSSSYKGNVVRHVKLVHRDVLATSAVLSFTSEKPRLIAEEGLSQAPPQVKTEDTSDGEETIVSDVAVGVSTSGKVVEDGVSKSPTRASVVVEPAIQEERTTGVVTAIVEENASKNSDPPTSKSQCSPTEKKTSTQGLKYCKACDISFNYLSTFIAHKKYYCTSHPTGRSEEAVSLPQVRGSSPGAG